jgi:ABC-type phosphate transport system substrate-binding protein
MNVMADVVIIVHPSNTAEVKFSDVNKLYLGRQHEFSNGTKAKMYALPEDHVTTFQFNDKVLSKTTSQLKAYWSKLIFTGKATAIPVLSSEEEIIDFVSKNPDAIGYVDKGKVNDTVKVVLSK